MPLNIGDPAPDFVLKNSEMTEVKLSDGFGKKNTVLLFFPAAFSGPCTQELCDVSQGLGFKADENTQVFGISADTPFALKAWAAQSGITTTLLSDYKREVINAYDAVLPDLAGLGPSAARVVVVIDKSGVVRYAQQTPEPKDMPDFAAVQQVLAGL
ncbi:MAG: redoxin domain-containing protein [Fimbriimonadaceae bacterium]|nr:redoxin domain-containing protein [Fimbriimonadaceae bacterium]